MSLEEKTLKVKMLGEFSLEYNGEVKTIERNSATKVNQILQLLLYHQNGISREQLLNYLFGNEKVVNPSNSLRAIVFRLRKILKEEGFPEDDYVHIKKGIYSWANNIPTEVDALEFEQKANRALEEIDRNVKEQLLEEVHQLYGGDFLPMISGMEWAVSLSIKYKKLYSQCTESYCKLCVRRENYKKLLEVSKKAAQLYPYDEWQTYEMEALIRLGKQEEAMKLYQETEALMFEELGVSVSEGMTKKLDELGRQLVNSTDMISTVQKNLESVKKNEEGAFLCTYPIFVENYRFIKRVVARSGQSAWLMLCTITDGKGIALDEGDRLDILAAELEVAIKSALRSGDMFTRYSDNQYVILLLDIVQEDCKLVENRINDRMEKESRKRYLHYNIAPINGVGIIDDESDDSNGLTWGDK